MVWSTIAGVPLVRFNGRHATLSRDYRARSLLHSSSPLHSWPSSLLFTSESRFSTNVHTQGRFPTIQLIRATLRGIWDFMICMCVDRSIISIGEKKKKKWFRRLVDQNVEKKSFFWFDLKLLARKEWRITGSQWLVCKKQLITVAVIKG